MIVAGNYGLHYQGGSPRWGTIAVENASVIAQVKCQRRRPFFSTSDLQRILFFVASPFFDTRTIDTMHEMGKADGIIADFVSSPDESRLDLSNCSLSELPESLNNPSIYSRLTLLNLANNHLQTLPAWLTSFPNLRILFLLGNAFTEIPHVVSQLPAVYMLSFKKNELSGTIRGNDLPKSITWLILTSNHITHLDDDFAVVCCKVRKLMLSNNRLSVLPSNFSQHMTELELLRLSNNEFGDFPTGIFDLAKLTWFSVAGNPCCGGTITSVDQLPERLRIRDIRATYDFGNGAAALGEGTSGSVFPAVRKRDGMRVALKMFKELAGSDGKALDEIWVSLACDGIAGLVTPCGYYSDATTGELILVTQLVPDNPKTIAGPPSFASCSRSVYAADVQFSAAEAELIVEQATRAVEGLLEKGIAHGDMYGHNVLVGTQRKDVALGDLGAAWRFPEEYRTEICSIERRALQVFVEEIESRVVDTKW